MLKQFNLCGLNISIRVRRKQTGGLFILLPESHLLDTMRFTPKVSSEETAKAEASNFVSQKQWLRDPGYTFAYDVLTSLASKSRRILDLGCSAGYLPAFLKAEGIWNDFIYLGLDTDRFAVKVAKQAHPEAHFIIADGSLPLDWIISRFDTVCVKGVLCSMYYPDQALGNLMNISSNSYLLLHVPIMNDDFGNGNFLSTLYADHNKAYLFTIFNKSYFFGVLQQKGFEIARHVVRNQLEEVINIGDFQLHDFYIKKRLENEMTP